MYVVEECGFCMVGSYRRGADFKKMFEAKEKGHFALHAYIYIRHQSTVMSLSHITLPQNLCLVSRCTFVLTQQTS